MNDVKSSWEKFLHPETLRGNLLLISLFITAFELFKNCIIEKPETFFSSGFNQDGIIVSDQYKTEVLSLSKSPMLSSLLWFRKMEAIDDADIKIYDEIRRYRNELTHELPVFLANANLNFDYTKFHALIDLLAKIEKWWVINFEAAIDPEMLPEGTDQEDIIPGVIMSLRLMFDIALGTEPEEGYYYNAFQEKSTGKRN